jgi:hypothetical protein
MSLTKVTYSMISGATANVLDFGATGDGVTDDALKIIEALDSLPNGGTLFFPKGTYIIGRAIPFRAGVHYLGESAESTILKASASSFDNILGLGYSTAGEEAAQRDVIVENLTFDGNKNNRTENNLALIGTYTGSFTRGEAVTSSSGGTAIVAAANIPSNPTQFITLYPYSVQGSFNPGDTVTGPLGVMTLVSRQADDAYQINIRAQALKKSVIRNCKIINSFFTALSLYSNCEQVLVDNCLVFDNNKTGTALSSPYNIYIESFAKDVIISNCYVSGGLGSGVTLRGGVCRGNKIINNTITNTANYGIEIRSNATDIVSDTVVSGNTLYAAPNGPADSINIFGNQTLYGTVIANNVIDTGTEPIGLRGNLDGVTVVGNTAINCTTPVAVVHGAGVLNTTFAGNVGNVTALNTLPDKGVGYQFPATPVLSANANTLDEYTEYTAASAACTGAITTSSSWRLTKIGNVVTLRLPTVSGIASATPNFSFGTAIPTEYRPPANIACICARMFDNATELSAPGMIFVTATTGVIRLSLDGTNTTNFTAGANAGLQSAVAISWLV